MPDTTSTIHIPLLEVNARADNAHHIVTGFETAYPALFRFWQQIKDSLSDIPALAAEVIRLGAALTTERRAHADLAAAGRATLAAVREAEADPLSYLRDELAAQGFERRPS